MSLTAVRMSAIQPRLGAAVDGGHCGIRRCGSDQGVREATDADGRTRVLCASHVAVYFPKG